jgi:Concanavalin A-like lectin/glucanases superfamily
VVDEWRIYVSIFCFPCVLSVFYWGCKRSSRATTTSLSIAPAKQAAQDQTVALTATVNSKGCVAPPQGLISWWPGDGNAKDIVGPNAGTLFGGATFAPGFVGYAFRFNGETAYVQTTTFNMPKGNADRTLEMWVKLDAIVPADNPTITYFESFFAGYGNFGTDASTFQIGAEYEPPYGNALFWSQWGDELVGPPVPVAGQHVDAKQNGIEGSEGGEGVPEDEQHHANHGWHHVAVTSLSGTNIGIVLFMDGVPVARRPNFEINTAAGTLFFMGTIPGFLGDIRRMKGELDEVSIYNRALSPHEIAAVFAAGKAGKCKP